MAQRFTVRSFTITSAAAILGVSRQTVIRAYHDGHLEGFRSSPAPQARIYIDADSLHAYQKTLRTRRSVSATA